MMFDPENEEIENESHAASDPSAEADTPSDAHAETADQEAIDVNAEAPEDSETTENPAEQAEEAPEEVEPLQLQLIRLQADFENFRKRTTREKATCTQQSLEGLMDTVLPALDSFDLGLNTAGQQEANASVVEGFTMVHQQLMDAFRKYGLKGIECVGIEFDPERHEAVNRMASEDVATDHILYEVRRGYELGDKLLRASQVVVSTGSADAANDTAEETSDA